MLNKSKKRNNTPRQGSNNITNTIKKLLGQYTVVSRNSVPNHTLNVLNTINGTRPRSQNVKNSKKVNKLTSDLVTTCNKILLKKESVCQCFDSNNHPLSDFSKCQKKKSECDAYNKCRKIFNKSISGAEPDYNPEDWSDPLIEGTHNCYMYFLNDQQDRLKKKCVNICKEKGKNNKACRTKKQNSCSNLKPQPGNYAYLKGNFKGNRRIYSCPAMIDKVLKDNYKKGTKKSKIIHWDHLGHEQQFLKKCPENYYKGVMVVHPKNTYHFYRQDPSGRFSHKQGTLRVENKDASGKPIYVPHLADMDYAKGDKSGINYTDFCGYMCVPKNSFADTQAN